MTRFDPEVYRQAAERVLRAWKSGDSRATCYYALRSDGDGCSPNHPDAVAWCLVGAICAEAGEFVSQYEASTDPLLYAALEEVGWNGEPHEYNDAPDRTREEVANVLRRAAKLTEAALELEQQSDR